MPASIARSTSASPAKVRKPRWPGAALVAICLGFFVVQLDVTIVNVALPAIGAGFGGSLAGLQWVVDGYTLALASMLLTAGAAADRSGARRVYLAGLACFAAGSAACAAAPDLAFLVTARVIQGVGASALIPASLALIVHRCPDARARARALGVWGGVGAVGVALGPVLGGALVDLVGWRAIFLVNLPVCAVNGWLLRRHVPESPADPRRRADVAGLLLGVCWLACATAAFIVAGEAGWLAPVTGLLAACAVAAAWLFVRAERRRESPMLPLGLFRSRPFSAATGVGFLFNLCLYGALVCVSLYLQQGRHESALATGLLVVPMSLAVGLGSVASGRVTARVGPAPMLAGLALAVAGAVTLAAVGSAMPLGVLVAGTMLLGLCSFAMPAMTAVVVGSAGPEHAGVASGVLNGARQAGGALGVALLGSLLAAEPSGRPLTLLRPLSAAAAGYVLAIVLARLATRPDDR